MSSLFSLAGQILTWARGFVKSWRLSSQLMFRTSDSPRWIDSWVHLPNCELQEPKDPILGHNLPTGALFQEKACFVGTICPAAKLMQFTTSRFCAPMETRRVKSTFLRLPKSRNGSERAQKWPGARLISVNRCCDALGKRFIRTTQNKCAHSSRDAPNL